MSDSLTRHSWKPNTRITHTRMMQPPTITSARSRSSPGLWMRSASCLGGDGAEHVFGRRLGEHEVVDAVAVVLGETLLDGGDRADGAGQADERRPPSRIGSCGAAILEFVAHVADGVRQLLGGGRVARAGTARSAARSRCRASGRLRLRSTPTTNSVEPPPMSTTRNGPSCGSRSAVAPAKLSRPSSSPLSNSGTTPSASSRRAEELVAVDGVARRRRGRRRAPWSTPCSSIEAAVVRAARRRYGRSPPGRAGRSCRRPGRAG